MRKGMILFIAVLSIFTLTSCVNNRDELSINNESKLIVNEVVRHELLDEWHISRFKLNNPFVDPSQLYDIGSSCYNNNNEIFYVGSAWKHMSNDCLGYDILKKNIKTEEVVIIYSNYDNNGSQISVIKYANGYLFWVEESVEGWQLVKYNLDKDEYNILDSSELTTSLFPPNIEVGSGLVFWYKLLPDSDTNEKNLILTKYSIVDDKYIEYEYLNQYIETPYGTVYSSDEYITYLTKENDKVIINVEHLQSQNVSFIKTDHNKVVSAIGNEFFIIWIDDWYESHLNIYNVKTKELITVSCENTDNNIRSIALHGKTILVDFSKIQISSFDSDATKGTSGIFKFNIKDSVLNQIYLSSPDENIAWINEHDGTFTVQSWSTKGDKDIKEIIFFNSNE